MAAVYDAALKQVIQFGGDDSSNAPVAETWVRSSGCWAQLSASSLPARDSVTAAYDAARSTVVVYGGRTGNPGQPVKFLFDTWTWNGKAWSLAANSGPLLLAPAAAYDPSSQRVIMFGTTADGIAQTWAWDGAKWIQLQPSTSPEARLNPSMAYDVTTSRLLLFGGDQTIQTLNDTWTWDGSNWHQMTSSSVPSARFGAAIASYEAGHVVLLFGGQSRSSTYADTWKWDGNQWTKLQTAHVPTPAGTVVAVNTGSATELIANEGSLWAWTGSDWALQ